MTEPNVNPQMPDDPGAPENTDEQFVSPDQAEAEAFEAELADAADADAEVDVDPVDPDADGDGTVSDVELQLAERTESLQRVSAEYANYRRRTERERTQIAELTKAKFAEKMLPILDDLDLAEQHGDMAEGPLKAFGDKLRSTLEGQSLKAFGAEGEAFDPEVHEAVQDLSEGDEKVIASVLRKGYTLGGTLVRNAMVIIGDPAAPADPVGASE
ncbi:MULTISPECIES: nucleotide exchange factor GrpE [Corynebacterium]|uniref:Protein GrpE n=1 Tax=Corynebacterium riegelii TaxID=156976 RepID=A0A0K1RDY6_9CORY|nr:MULTISPECIES: nucleotide exchange factor GrpE [Corynebacterium]AKV59603.1 heat -hock protein GrpE [Corynebacterium riegelii]MDK7181496.1 nucleotide exchange factor GrpE [Corynebacterium riegelii]OFT78208.1 nucleotide exchange factor GrpE [Corynebacterium sp. HMSC30G07]QQU84316.1 nucleotide exchange factor GrpE [Corynebacterium riegelii]